MAIFTGDVNRVTGLSGIDTESMIDKMMKAESAKYERYQREEVIITWRQEAYREIISSVQSFQEKWFGINRENNLGFNAAWDNYITSVKDSTGEDSNAITINGSSDSGKYDIEVTQVAQTESITGNGVLESNITTGNTAQEISNSIKDLDELSFEFDLDGTKKNITITKAELDLATGATESEKLKNVFNDKLKQAFGTTDGGINKVKVDLKEDKLVFTTGASNSLTINDGSTVSKNNTITQTGALSKDKTGEYMLQISANGETYTIKADFTADDTADERIKKISEGFKKATNSSGSVVDISKDIDIHISKDGDDIIIKNTSSSENYEVISSSLGGDALAGGKLNSNNNLAYLGIEAGSSTSVSEDTKLAQAFGEDFKTYFDANKNEDDVLEFKFGEKTITINENDTIKTFMNKVNSSTAGFEVGFNEITGRFKIESSQSGANGQIEIDPATNAKEIGFIKDFLGIDLSNKDNNAIYIKGQDAKFSVDGIETTRPSNDINMNGLQFTINGITEGKVTVSASGDTDATLKKMKEFVEDYNKLVSKLEEQVNQTREKSSEYGYYEPLLPEEKEAMSEDEIKKWEEKAKSGLLYKDDLLGGILSDLRGMVYEEVDIGGDKISLFEIGITTSNEFNSNKLEIDEEKLKKAIEEKGDDIASMFTAKNGVADKIETILENSVGTNGSLRKKAGIKGTSSVTQNDLSNSLKDLAQVMSKEKDRLYNKEMTYFEMFARMESLMSYQNSQMSMMMGILGQ